MGRGHEVKASSYKMLRLKGRKDVRFRKNKSAGRERTQRLTKV